MRLIIFTRYPEPGKTKTRLIPALGAEGAARLQGQLTEHTLRQLGKTDELPSYSIEVRFAGGNRELMAEWLGPGKYEPQGEGDLGTKIYRAFATAFATGIEKVAIVGIDCPDLDASIAIAAFDRLNDSDLVLGPAVDGGYYLIGLRQTVVPELFAGISWGSDKVLQQTVDAARKLNLSYSLLPELADIDRPEDLEILADRPSFSRENLKPKTSPKISIIVPALNEALAIATTISKAKAAVSLPLDGDSGAIDPEEIIEIIVADGGSRDGTVQIARSAGVKVISGVSGRASQMNAGAKAATGEILLFLHADTLLPAGFDAMAIRELARVGVVAGAFPLKINGTGVGLRWVEKGVNWRSRFLSLPYGDQAIFLRAKLFWDIGGFPEMPIMEDFALMGRLRPLGKVAIAEAPVLTSPRRWQKLGVLRVTLINQLIIIGYFLGVPPAILARWYRGAATRSPTEPRS
ncbi:MAG: DUF2064 domain-containing protein [Oscillatoria sp. SIO1A7]|nr:DUF2064 domain-containing protein [Oscillatoria sp. SIO1A7]